MSARGIMEIFQAVASGRMSAADGAYALSDSRANEILAERDALRAELAASRAEGARYRALANDLVGPAPCDEGYGRCGRCRWCDDNAEVLAEIEEPIPAIAAIRQAEAAMVRVAESPHCAYPVASEDRQYATGVADGHRCAAYYVRAALAALREQFPGNT